MAKQLKYSLFSKGLNFMGQLGLQNKYQNSSFFQRVPSLQDKKINQLEAHMTQSFALLDDNQLIHWGWLLDQLTATRTLSFYKRNPTLCQFWQKYSFFGSTIGMRNGQESPLLINKGLLDKINIKKFSVGGSFVHILGENGDVYGLGENYKGQLGIGETTYQMNFLKIPLEEKAIDIYNGFQHSLILTQSGRVYAAGRCNNFQYYPSYSKGIVIDSYSILQLMLLEGQVITKISAGFHHSLFATKNQKLYAIGLNNYGQCGQASLDEQLIKQLTEVFIELESGEIISQIASGKSHNLILTSNGRLIFFGATIYNQLGTPQCKYSIFFKIFIYKEFNFDQSGPCEIKLPLGQNETIIKIKCAFDFSAAFTNTGDCFIWGGNELDDKYDFPHYKTFSRVKDLIGIQNCRVVDVGLGYTHTLIYIEE